MRPIIGQGGGGLQGDIKASGEPRIVTAGDSGSAMIIGDGYLQAGLGGSGGVG